MYQPTKSVPAWQPPSSAQQGKSSGWLLWVSEMDSNRVSALDPVTRQVVASIPTGPMPRRIAIAPGL